MGLLESSQPHQVYCKIVASNGDDYQACISAVGASAKSGDKQGGESRD